MALQRYGGLELSVLRAFKKAPSQYASAYRWFLDNEGFIGPRPWGNHVPAGVDVKLCAQSGIQKPAGYPYAISVTSAGTDVYSNDALHHFEDGTWLFEYCAHRLNTGETQTKIEYNRSLRRCLERGLPVGVFIKLRASTYQCLGLAFVEQYDSVTGVFLLHGPCHIDEIDSLSPVSQNERRQLEKAVRSDADRYDFDTDEVADALFDTLPKDEDERTKALATIVRRKRQAEFRKQLLVAYNGRCAISRFDTAPALQAAHISSYLGPSSQKVTNGLLLRADLHILFDSMLISVDPSDMAINISKQLENSSYGDLRGRHLALPRDKHLWPSECRLGAHHDTFLRKESNISASQPPR